MSTGAGARLIKGGGGSQPFGEEDAPLYDFTNLCKNARNIEVSLRLRVQNAVSAQPCVGKFRISLVLLNFLHCNFRLWFETP